MKKKLVFWSLLVPILLFCIVFVSCDNSSNDEVGSSTVPYTIRYEITGPQVIADIISYTNENGNTETISNIPIPWEKSLILQGRRIVSCRAIYSNISGLTYTAKIFLNNREIASANSSHASVNVSGSTQ